MNQLVIYWLYFIVIISSSCTDKSEFKGEQRSRDYVYVGEFTQGLEGPVVHKNGNLYFVNPVQNGTIGKVVANTQKLEIYIDSLPNGSVANGLRFNSGGMLLMADYVNHQILSLDVSSGKISIYAYDSTMNQPNDIAITGNNLLFASDPNWATETGNIWRIDTLGIITLLESNMGTTNGIEVAPGDSILYVNESVQRKVWKYDLDKKGQISNKTLLIEFDSFGLDGMRCDSVGNLFISRYGKGVVAIVSPDGKLIEEVKLSGQKPTNLAFGGTDGKTVYVTCQDRGYIEMFTADFPGRAFKLKTTNDNYQIQ